MSALTLFIIISVLLSAFGVTFIFFRKEEATKKLLEAKEKLRKIEALEHGKLMAVIGSLADGVVVLDPMHHVFVANNAAREFLSLSNEHPATHDIIAQFPREIEIQDKIKEANDKNHVLSLNDVKIDGKTFQVYITPVHEMIKRDHHEVRKPLGTTILLQDITHEKELEKMREEFSHVIVHELRAPLTAVKDAAALLLQKRDGNVDEDEKQLLTLMHDQSKKLLFQVSSLLDAAKIEDGKFRLDEHKADIKPILEQEAELFVSEAKRKNITLISEIPPTIPELCFDPTRISQVINNLISNSIKYTKEGGTVKLNVTTREDSHEGQQVVVISVSDNGLGIPKEKQPFLFTKFTELTDGTSPNTKRLSSGLGLYITKGIVEAHGGTIQVESEVDKGTTVTFTIPVRNEAETKTVPLIASIKPNTTMIPQEHMPTSVH